MKTAISLPDEVGRRIDDSARRHGMSRSEFYRRAALRYAEELDGEGVTEQIDQAVARAGQPGADTAELRAVSAAVVAGGDDW